MQYHDITFVVPYHDIYILHNDSEQQYIVIQQ